MILRILWDIALVITAFVAPWWVALLVGIGGCILFPWYVEIIFAGAIYDALYGGTARHFLSHFLHTGIFAVPLLAGEFIKTNVFFKK